VYSTGAPYYTATTVNGRPAFTAAGNNVLLATPATPAQTVVLLVESSASVVSYETWARVTGDNIRNLLVRSGTSAGWYSDGGSEHYVDGVASNVIPTTGVHVFEGFAPAAGAYTASEWGGATREPYGKIAFSAALTDAQSADERADTLSDLRRYYRIAP
jgi:hypothetical protein